MAGGRAERVRSLNPAAVEMPPSGIREIVNLAINRPDVIRLEVGEPNFATPAHIVQGALRGIADGFTRYTQSHGLLSLRTLLAEKIQRRTGVLLTPDQVIVGVGGVQVIFATLLTLIDGDRGDEVLLPDPGWPNYEMAVVALRGRPVRYPLHIEDAFVPRIEDLERLVSPRTRVLILNTPSNPTGAVFPRPAVTALMEFAARHDLWVLADEVYEELIFEDEHVSPFALDPARTVMLNSFSKTYSMTGWRVGYAATIDAEVARALAKVQEPQISSVAGPAQKAAEAALLGPQTCVAEMRAAYRDRRDAVVSVLRAHDLYSYQPRGAFYLMLDVSRSGMDGHAFTLRLLDEERVAVAPGTAFGDVARNQVRISLATEREALLEGVERACRLIARLASGTPVQV
jgi:aspartate/methionine/tyrosine aminotransferase